MSRTLQFSMFSEVEIPLGKTSNRNERTSGHSVQVTGFLKGLLQEPLSFRIFFLALFLAWRTLGFDKYYRP